MSGAADAIVATVPDAALFYRTVRPFGPGMQAAA